MASFLEVLGTIEYLQILRRSMACDIAHYVHVPTSWVTLRLLTTSPVQSVTCRDGKGEI